MRRRALLGSIASTSAATLGSCVDFPPNSAGPSGDAGRESRPILGAYPGPNPSRPERFEPFERWLGRRFGVIVLYANADDSPDAREEFFDGMTRVWRTGHVPVVTWESYVGSAAETPNTIIELIRDGGYDEVIERWAIDLADWVHTDDRGTDIDEPRRFYFRPFPEMNGDWVPWSVLTDRDVQPFVDAWRRVYGIVMDEIGGRGDDSDVIQWLWNPNATEHGDVPTEACYPGDAYVDWIGIDGYNFGSSVADGGWRTPAEVFEPMRSRLVELAEKPLALPEFGTTSVRDGRPNVAAKRDWIDRAFTYVADHDIRMSCWFNVDKEADWAVFGGERGTDVYRDPKLNRTFPVYDAFRERVEADGYLAGNLETTDVLSPTAFQGGPARS